MRASAAPEPGTAKLRLTAGTRTLDVNGRPARVFSLVGPNGKPGITLPSGERFNVDVVNQAGTPTIVHWHGQLPPWTQDGFPWSQTPLIPAGDSESYDYAPIAGTLLDALASGHAGTEPDDRAAHRAQRRG
jgi:FtsP/CotA-like multicopper oxidase with cupredoxin domain